MFIRFTTINKKHSHNEIERKIWDDAERVIKEKIISRFQNSNEDLIGVNIHVEIDMSNSNAKVIGEDIPDGKLEAVKRAFKNEK